MATDTELKEMKAWVFKHLREKFDGFGTSDLNFEEYVRANYETLKGMKEHQAKNKDLLPTWMEKDEEV